MRVIIIEKIKKLLPNGLNIIDLLAFFLVLAFCFILFQHGDLFYTSSSSYAYLHGHIFNFYDYNKTAVGRDDYLPLIYVIFAAWNMPLKLLGLMHDVASAGTYLTIVELVWTKLLLVAFYFDQVQFAAQITAPQPGREVDLIQFGMFGQELGEFLSRFGKIRPGGEQRHFAPRAAGGNRRAFREIFQRRVRLETAQRALPR